MELKDEFKQFCDLRGLDYNQLYQTLFMKYPYDYKLRLALRHLNLEVDIAEYRLDKLTYTRLISIIYPEIMDMPDCKCKSLACAMYEVLRTELAVRECMSQIVSLNALISELGIEHSVNLLHLIANDIKNLTYLSCGLSKEQLIAILDEFNLINTTLDNRCKHVWSYANVFNSMKGGHFRAFK